MTSLSLYTSEDDTRVLPTFTDGPPLPDDWSPLDETDGFPVNPTDYERGRIATAMDPDVLAAYLSGEIDDRDDLAECRFDDEGRVVSIPFAIPATPIRRHA